MCTLLSNTQLVDQACFNDNVIQIVLNRANANTRCPTTIFTTRSGIL